MNEWKEGIEYKIGERVVYNNSIYKCLQNHKSEMIYSPERYNNILWTNYYKTINDNTIVYLWYSGTYYYVNTVVLFSNKIYKCIKAHISTPYNSPRDFYENAWIQL